MNIFARLSIKSKFLILFLAFIIPLLYFVSSNIYQELVKQKNLSNLKNKLEKIEELTALIHEIQLERGYYEAFKKSKDEDYKEKLSIQKALVNQHIRAIEKADKNVGLNLKSTDYFRNLPQVRQFVLGQEGDSSFVKDFYTDFINSVLEDINNFGQDITDPQILSQLQTLYYLGNSKESLASIRSLLLGCLSLNRFSRKDYGIFSLEKGKFDLYKNQFRNHASSAMLQEFNAVFKGEGITQTQHIIAALSDTMFLSTLKITRGKWEKISTDAVNKLREVEIGETEILIRGLNTKIAQVKIKVGIFVALIVGIFAITIAISTYIIRLFTYSIYKIKEAADKINLGDTNIKIAIHTKDELADLASSFNNMAQRNYSLSLVADAIGRGEYNTNVQIRSEKDLLGIALLKLKTNLQELSERDYKRSFILIGNGFLNDLIRSEKNLKSFSTKVIQHVCNYLGLPLGAFHVIKEDNIAYLIDSFGIKKEGKPQKVPVGEGLVGQAAQDKEILVLKNIPEGYFNIESTFLNEKPSCIYLIPLIFQQECHGVIELATIQELSSLQEEYIKNISEKIAIGLVNIKTDLKSTELLLETQNQSEEMEVQQEELRQINEELKEQSLKLQSSEEELRASQEELQEKNSELEEKANQLEEQYEAIRSKNKQLEQARGNIEEKVEQLELTGKYRADFLANMSHELRTPLNSVLILANLLAENKEKNLTEKQREFAKVIHKSGTDLLTLINEILDLSKIEAGKINLKIESFSVDEIKMQALFDEVAQQNKIKFNVELSPNLPKKVSTDKFRLEQVLKNLLSNAFKFTPTGGEVTLSFARASQNKYFRSEILQAANEVLEFSVTDTGIGIPKDKQSLIFEAFQQADSSTSRKYGGTGLGLAISREIVSLLGGEITLQSEPGKGSKFSVFLPAEFKGQQSPEHSAQKKNTPEAQQIAYPQTSKAIAPTSERTIVIIEDDFNFATVLKDYAEEKHFKPFITDKGKEGIELAKKYRPDAILLDIFLPEINGLEILKLLKSDPATASIPIHIISAADEADAGKKLGAVNYIQKPASPEALRKIFEGLSKTDDKRKILIIEDNEAQNYSLKEFLKSRGFYLELAFSGKVGLEKIKEKKYDCIILDLNLPDIDGFHLLEKVKKENLDNGTPFVIYSGRELTAQEEVNLKKYTNAIIIKTGDSYNRLLDEVNLFLHKVKEDLPKHKEIKPKPLRPNEVLKDKKVLLVDDDIRNIYALYNVFEAYQLKIITAGNGKEALEKLEDNQDTAIVLMDIMMPEMDGYEAMRLIRQKEKFASLPIIALTAKAMKGDREKCIQAGASDYIAKPVDTERLLSLMRVWLYDKNK